MDKLQLLRALRFGERVAEEEVNEIERYFVETDQWQRMYAGEVEIVYGPKGSGKSAIYALINRKQDDLAGRSILVAPAENVRGDTVFRSLVTDPPPTEPAFVYLWKLHFLVILGKVAREWSLSSDRARTLVGALEQAGLLLADTSIASIFRAVSRHLKGLLDRDVRSVEWTLGMDPITNLPKASRKVTFDEDEDSLAELPVDELLRCADLAFQQDGTTVWIVLDRLDVAFAESPELEKSALRALFRTYNDLKALDNVKLKIFVRDDIWRRISSGGFTEASHIIKTITIDWDENSLLNVVVRRLLNNADLVTYLHVNKEEVLGDFEAQKDLLRRIFPAQIDTGRNPQTLGWMLNRTVDASEKNAPREIVHLLECTRNAQIKRLERGEAEPAGEVIFERAAFKEGLEEVSKVRYEQTLLAEYPDLKQFLEKLEGEKAEQTPASLSRIWNVSEEGCLGIAARLIEVGFFQARAKVEGQQTFWVPFLYRDALNLVQGMAD